MAHTATVLLSLAAAVVAVVEHRRWRPAHHHAESGGLRSAIDGFEAWLRSIW